MPWPTNFAPPYLGPDMDYTLFKWLAPTLEYMEGGGKPSPASQMLLVVVIWRGKNRRSCTCKIHNVIELSTKNKEHRLYLYPSMFSRVLFVTSTRSRSIKQGSTVQWWTLRECRNKVDRFTQDRKIARLATIAVTTTLSKKNNNMIYSYS